MPNPSRSAWLLAAAFLAACQTQHRVAGSLHVPAGGAQLLELRAERAADLRLQLWNRGPGAVRFTNEQPASDVSGVLSPDRSEFTWLATTGHLVISLEAEQDATVAYAVQSSRDLELNVRPRSTP